jgi:hypothetical protein
METPPIVITYDNAPTETSHFFFETCTRNGWVVKHLGLGEKWEGFTNKIKAYAKLCRELPSDQIVVISDARDVFCVRPPKAFIEGFLEFKGDIVVSTELLCEGNFEASETDMHTQCYPLNKYYEVRGIKPGIRKYINSGLIAGRAKSIADMWTWILENKFTDDQLGVCKYAVTFPERIELDLHAQLLHSSTFGVNAGIQSIHIQKHDSPTFAELMGCGAFFLHIPGNKNKGQSNIYNMVKLVLEKYMSNHLFILYNYPIPAWNEIF